MKKIRYWKNFISNWPIIIPHTLGLGLASFLLYSFMQGFNLVSIQLKDEPIMFGMFCIMFVMAFMKLMSWLGWDLINNWANKLSEVLTR